MTKKARYKTWYKQAQYDLEAAKLSYENSFYEWASYQAEQAVEKTLKSVIVHAGENPPRLHKLSVLFGYCNSLNKRFRNTKFDFRHLESFTFISRYPFLLPGKDKSPHELISKNDASVCISQADRILEQVHAILESEFEPGDIELPAPISDEALEVRLQAVTDALVRTFNPYKIVLFGSYARKPLPRELTTMDILVIADTDLSFVNRITQAREATKGGVPTIEPLVYTPEEYEIMTKVEGESFFESALDEGRVLYENHVSPTV